MTGALGQLREMDVALAEFDTHVSGHGWNVLAVQRMRDRDLVGCRSSGASTGFAIARRSANCRSAQHLIAGGDQSDYLRIWNATQIRPSASEAMSALSQ